MDNMFLVKALAAHSAICSIHDRTKIDASVFLKRANDAVCIIESYADGSMIVKEDHIGRTWFSRKTVEPNADPKTAKEQPLVAANDAKRVVEVLNLAEPGTREYGIALGHVARTCGGYARAVDCGIMTPDDARFANGLPPIAKAA